MEISTNSQITFESLKKNLFFSIYICFFLCIWLWTFLGAYNVNVWLLENVLLFVLVFAALFTYKKYPLSQVAYILLITFILLHLYGARYTYENNPFGLWIQQLTDSSRNSYDRIVHFSFGLFWTYPLVEINKKYLRLSIVTAMILAFACISTMAAFYEVIEWIIGGIFFPEQGIAFIGQQGDRWDTQKDIFLGLAGSVIALSYLAFSGKRNTA
jgi:putative membrane protein